MNPWYAATYEMSREIVEERLRTADKARLSKGTRIGRKMRNLTKGVFRS
jgi:hypothetical protein